MKTTNLRFGMAIMITLFLTCLGSFAFANGTPTGNTILEINNQSYNGTFDPGEGHLLTSDITELLCEKVDVEFIGVDIDANSSPGQILVAIYENGNLLTHSGFLTVQGGVDELVGFNPSSTLEMNASSTYTLGVMYSGADPIYFKTSNAPVHSGPLSFSVLSSTVDHNSTFPVLPTNLVGTDMYDFNVGFRILGTLTSTHSNATLFVSSCGEYNAPSGNATYMTDGVYTDVITNAVGCDSVLTLHVTINSPVYETEQIDACNDYTWQENNQTYTSSGTYYTQYVGANGCDSVRVLELVVHNNNSTVQEVSVCESFTWSENGQTYDSSGIYTETYQNVLGCDSVVILDLDVSYPNIFESQVESCGSYYWDKSGLTYTNSGIYNVEVQADGQECPDIYQLSLTVNPEIAISQSQTACGGYYWPVDGNMYTNSGTYTGYLTSSTGCDTLVTLDLLITDPTYTEDVVVTCAPSYTWVNGVTYTSNNNSAVMMYQGVNGCDSIVTLNLSFVVYQVVTETIVTCDDYTWVNGVTYTQTPTTMPSVTTTTTNGCDLVTYLDLTILEPTSATHTVTACDSYTWIDGNTYTSSNNTATYTLVNAAGCDSVVTLDLTIAPLDNSVSVSGLVLTSNQANAQYQWYENDNGLQLIQGATGQSYTATQNGEYVVEVTQGSCNAMSAGSTINVASLDEYGQTSVIISPNPSNGQFAVSGEWDSVELYDLTGRAININADPISKQVTTDKVASGKYILAVQLKNSEVVVLDVIME
ncbi:MAG: T9SS type A sorting domain-containing protein [bacterium]|nr:T9SS type A sorting domain-containing protein [bacterium]